MWQALRDELHPRGLEIVTVALDTGGVADARPWIEAANAQHPSLIDQAHVTDELFGFVNVPNGVWIDEEGVIVRPAEPAFPGPNPVMSRFRDLDVSTLAPEIAEVMAEVAKIRTDPEGYRAAIVDWVDNGGFALTPDEVVARSQPRSPDVSLAAAHFELGQHLHRQGDVEGAIEHFKAAHARQPDNWTYKRQAWHFAAPGSQTRNDVYDSSWVEDIKATGAESYYPAFVP